MGKARKNFYAVRVGRNPGIYDDWQDCQQQVLGFSRAEYQGFTTYSEAQGYLYGNSDPVPQYGTQDPVYAPSEQIQNQHHEAADAYNTEQEPSDDDSEAPHCEDCRVCYPDVLYRLEFDGGARGNPGPAGAGAVLIRDSSNKEVGSICVGLGHATNNVAEYTGLVQGLQAALACGATRILCQGDSNLVVQQVSGRWQVKSAGLRSLHAEACSLAQCFDEFYIRHVWRDQNQIADALSNDAMDGYGWDGFKDRLGRIRRLVRCRGCNRLILEGQCCEEPTSKVVATCGVIQIRDPSYQY